MSVAILPVSKRLTFRILLSTLIGLGLTLTAIAYTLVLSWQLEGGGAAINEAGSLRMRSYRLAVALEHTPADVPQQLREFSRTLTALQEGDAKRPLFLPTSSSIRLQMQRVVQTWEQRVEVDAKAALTDSGSARQQALSRYMQELPLFVDSINVLVSLVEVELAEKTTWLRLCQTALTFMSLAASVALLYLLYLWIVGPVSRMQSGIARMSNDDLSVRLPIESEDEFGVLAHAFNQMADRVQTVHRTLEQRVLEKTAQLQEQHHEISTLYEIAGFLAGPHAIEELCRGFLHRIMQRIAADGGTVRILDNHSDHLHITVHEGISEQMIEEEHCIKTDACFCGTATQQGIILIRDFRQLNQQHRFRCQDEGFFSLAVFQILAREQVIGSFSLHFRAERVISREELRLLETLGKNLGTAIENQRLIAKEKEFAVSQERNLLAQGLHDSIAQGLNFLNLQVQMLEDSLKRQAYTEIVEITPLLRAGVQESYEDVRELLLNFRTRLQDSDLISEMRNVLNKFQRQTGIATDIALQGNGAALASEQQLQVLFILQEALSNVRKHADASLVSLHIRNERDFSFVISDNGQGFDLSDVQGEEHIGLRIMRERAQRLSATFEISSERGVGTHISLHVLRQERLVA
ncbi:MULTISPECIES: type IV pili methyl-accepting chemotaxis transducer N-terminal domain-containing protein [unclassified Undibacterium]|uniref:type IV pili methyl-accepting chemotaxis transducer N-terminal domain-containing protein n=1 Tax=unclassified Undibacterium TaxID=2630295 RepID=UPI002AC8FBCB|nr:MULTISPECIES: type IV pili methyl-accepting chemotaxis transducer N-terminal domain-containing protein [unclassified Undibacterium]MEB0138087.1 type IV pili methyl-accepting chemotaxis transducer N-terminal domain-containing protein [Undibacterium sp. CCC2.1]MEB0171175.1 type IV pili methyl-accepting chemotaxis transducer N-terminal domain-containing protein [Undibacterium sp. CCC1.1]MEB0175220.1 type IV pili methyl-accepting chemotaxis transducer N-terminal domain-containing protein [Undibac